MTVIVLNDSLSFVDDTHDTQYQPNILARYWGYSREHVLEHVSSSASVNLRNHGLFGMISHAYTYHKPVTINPTDIWILIVSQFKTIIKDNSNHYRHLFTESDDKTDLAVPTNSAIELPVNLVVEKLKEHLKFDVNLVSPSFSTDTSMANEVKTHLLLDMASPYFSYSMFMCGIPSIKIGGTTEDWVLLEDSFLKLNELFYLEYDNDYLQWQCSVAHIVSTLHAASKGEYDVDFFKDIFTQSNIGSGPELSIKGWITSLFYKMPKVPKIENFNSHVSSIEYSNRSTGGDYVMISGGFGCEVDEDGFYTLEYSKHIFVKTPRTERFSHADSQIHR